MNYFIKQFFGKLTISAIALITGGLMITACGQATENAVNSKSSSAAEQQKTNVDIKPENANSANDTAKSNQSKNENQIKKSGKCELTKAPEIKGFTIGQTVEEIDRRFPGFKAAYDKEKANETEQNKKTGFVLVTSGSQELDKTALNGKEFDDYQFIWHFLDGKLIGYVVKDLSDATANLDLKAFLAKVAKENNLPQDGWKIGKEDDADLACQSFEVSITAGGQPGMSVMIFDAQGEKEKEKREREQK